MVDKTITSANSVFMFGVTSVFPTPQRLQGYSSDAAYVAEAVTEAETQMGIDGILSGGFTPVAKKTSVTLQADSPSIPVFEQWIAAQKQAREIFRANATVAQPSVQRKYTLTRGILTTYTPFAEAGKLLKARTFVIEWEDITGAPM